MGVREHKEATLHSSLVAHLSVCLFVNNERAEDAPCFGSRAQGKMTDCAAAEGQAHGETAGDDRRPGISAIEPRSEGEGGHGDRLLLHIVVVGFHHQLGNLCEYIYPPLTPDEKGCKLDSSASSPAPPPSRAEEMRGSEGRGCSPPPPALPTPWRFLPYLALPDGVNQNDEGRSTEMAIPARDLSRHLIVPCTQ